MFRLGIEWLAIDILAAVEVTSLRPVHRVPHRTNAVFSGLINLRGQLHPCVSLHGLLAIDAIDPTVNPPIAPRLILIRKDGDTWAFPADEVAGVQQVLGRTSRTSRRRCRTRRELQPGRLRLGAPERERPGRAPPVPRAPEDGSMSDDLSGFSLMDLFRSEADGQVATLSEGLIALEGSATTSQAIEPLMRAAHSLKGAARIVGLEPAVRIAHALEDAFVAAQAGEFVDRCPARRRDAPRRGPPGPDRPARRRAGERLGAGQRGDPRRADRPTLDAVRTRRANRDRRPSRPSPSAGRPTSTSRPGRSPWGEAEPFGCSDRGPGRSRRPLERSTRAFAAVEVAAAPLRPRRSTRRGGWSGSRPRACRG